jgi:hypothetical protein
MPRHGPAHNDMWPVSDEGKRRLANGALVRFVGGQQPDSDTRALQERLLHQRLADLFLEPLPTSCYKKSLVQPRTDDCNETKHGPERKSSEEPDHA